MEFFQSSLKWWRSTYRDPRYVIALFAAGIVLVFLTIAAAHSYHNASDFDTRLFHTLNSWPDWLFAPLYVGMQLGVLGSIFFWGMLATYWRNWRAGGVVAGAGIVAWLVAKPLKVFIGRPRPSGFFDNLQHLGHEHLTGFGFPSGHATVSAACVTALYVYAKPAYRKYLVALLLVIGLGRIYTGAHLPTDVFGGWALGIAVGAAVSLLLGVQRDPISMIRLKARLRDMGVEAVSARKLAVDARGSVPVMVEASNGKKYLIKLFGKEEHAADWIFKAIRYFRYKSLGDEEPYFNAKRNVEHEASASLWAQRAGVHCPEVIGYAQVGQYWMLAQQAINAKQLDNLPPTKLTDVVIRNIWREVRALHKANIAHRDLRASNVMVDRNSQAWLIDFGFAEVSAQPKHKKIDVAELLMSMSLVAGVDRTFKIAKQVLGKEALVAAASYVQMAVFSGATTTMARKNREIYNDLRERLAALSGKDAIEEADVVRLKPKLLINLGLIGLFLFLVVPQFKAFHGSLQALASVNPWWVLLVFGFSIMTYIASAIGVVTLSPVPIKLRRTLLVQLAGSFASKMLPSGLGSAALMIRFLSKSGLDKTTATSLIVVQRLIDFVMFILPLGLVLALSSGSVRGLFNVHVDPDIMMAIGGVVLLAAILVVTIPKLRGKVVKHYHNVVEDFKDFASSPREVTLTAIASLAVTVMYVACLFVSMRAVGLDVSLFMAFVVYATATIAGTASPAPGGLGALEIAMVAAMLGMGLAQPQAYAAVILYRLTTYWAPIPFGFVAYQFVQKRQLA